MKKMIQLKNDSFTYLNKKYVQQRYISEDKTLYITSDGLDYFRPYTGNKEGKAQRIYLTGNKDYYSLEEILKAIEADKEIVYLPIDINPTHYKK